MPGATSDQAYVCTLREHEDRVFCRDRWNESKALPAIMLGITSCYFTRHHNFFVVRNPVEPTLGEYFVYFSVRLNAAGFVDIDIESAYPRRDGHREKREHKTSMNALLVNTVRGVPTFRPR